MFITLRFKFHHSEIYSLRVILKQFGNNLQNDTLIKNNILYLRVIKPN